MLNIMQNNYETKHKIILRHAAGWQRYDNARIHISVLPNPNYDTRARSILNWAIENFDQVTLCLHDSIQRYNIMATGVNEADAYNMAIENGNQWLAKNIFAPDVFIDVVRWDQLLANPSFEKTKESVQQLYNNNSEFRESVDFDLNTFADRCRKRGELYPPERMKLSQDFIIEEIAGYIPLFQSTSAVDIHPGMRMKAMQLLIDGVGNFNFMDNLMVSIKTFDLKQEYTA